MFDVDVAEGAPPLKLPMNKGDDPYDAAEIFLQKHQLPFSYLEQVIEFIQQNTGANGEHLQACPLCSVRNNCSRCFVVMLFGLKLKLAPKRANTGRATVTISLSQSSAAVSNACSSIIQCLHVKSCYCSVGSTAQLGFHMTMPCADVAMAAPMDPFTGGGAYVPPTASAQPSTTATGFMDPFTGAGAYVPDDMNTPTQQAPSIALPTGLVYAPHSQYQGFEAVPDPGKVASKIRELAASVPAPNSCLLYTSPSPRD